MKTRFIIHFLSVLFLLASCNFTSDDNSSEDSYSQFTKLTKVDSDASRSGGSLSPFNTIDSKSGLPLHTVYYPSDWKQLSNDKEWTFMGPNDIKISREFGQFFTFGNSYGGSTYNQRSPMNIHSIIEEFFMTTARQNQRSLIRVYELPKIAQVEHQYRVQLWSYAPSQKNTQTYAIEWEDPNQMKFITLLHVFVDRSQLGSMWGFYGHYLQANTAHFDLAKNAFIKGMESKKYNPQAIAAYNRSEMQKANVRYEDHKVRMAAINARGNAIANTGKIYSDILDISHSGYLSRSNMTSHGHSKSISGIHETVTISNHNTSEHYSVPMGNKHYWVSNDGTYFGTDNSLLNPNTEANLNDKEWTKFEIEQ